MRRLRSKIGERLRESERERERERERMRERKRDVHVPVHTKDPGHSDKFSKPNEQQRNSGSKLIK